MNRFLVFVLALALGACGEDMSGLGSGNLNPCAGVVCSNGSACTVQNGQATCPSSATCTGVQCLTGQTCAVRNNVATCEGAITACSTNSCPSGQFCQVLDGRATCLATCTEANCLTEAVSVEVTRAPNSLGFSASTGWRAMVYRQDPGLSETDRRYFGSGDALTYTFVRSGFVRGTDMRSNSFEERNLAAFANQTAAAAGYRIVYRYSDLTTLDVSSRVLVCADPNSFGSSGQYKLEMWRKIGEQRCAGIP